jgi:hypothetical protein
MFVQRHTGRIATWFVVFWARVPSRLHNLLVPGRFKHVAAFGYTAEARTWIFIDPEYRGTDVLVVPEHEGAEAISAFIVGASVLRIDARKRCGVNFRLFSCCTTTVRDLIGLDDRGIVAMLPDSLYRDCLRAGAVEVIGAPPRIESPLCVERRGAPRHDPQHGIEPASPA